MRNAAVGTSRMTIRRRRSRAVGTLSFVKQPSNRVTGPIPSTPAHAARPAPHHGARLAALGAVLLAAIGLGIAAQRSAGAPVRSTPSSALLMKDDPTSSAASSVRQP